MKRILPSAALAAALLGGALVFAAPPAAAEPDTKFGSCAQMRAVDPNGVAATPRAVKRAVKQGYRKPLLCPVAYAANKRLDKDRDGVACERKR